MKKNIKPFNQMIGVDKRKIKFFILFLVSPFFFYTLVGTVLSFSSTNWYMSNLKKGKVIYVKSNDFHLDLILPVEDIDSNLKKILKDTLCSGYCSFGCGDKTFYMDSVPFFDYSTIKLMKIMLFSKKSVIRTYEIDCKGSDWYDIPIDTTQLRRINYYIYKSFLIKDNTSVFVPEITNGPDNFFESVYNYSAINTCNNWVNSALKYTGITTSIWSPTPYGTTYFLKRIAK